MQHLHNLPHSRQLGTSAGTAPRVGPVVQRSGGVFLFVFLCLLLMIGESQARILLDVRVDFGDDLPDPAGAWNVVGDADINRPLASLLDFQSGLATSIGLVAEDWLGDDPILGTWNGGADFDWIDNAAVRDDFYTDAASASVRFTGLLTGLRYRLEVLSAYQFFDPLLMAEQENINDLQVRGAAPLRFADRNARGEPGLLGDDWNAKVDGFDGVNFLIWDQLQPNADGELLLALSPAPGTVVGTDLTAARLTVTVPTATSIALIVAAGLALVNAAWWVRRRRHALV